MFRRGTPDGFHRVTMFKLLEAARMFPYAVAPVITPMVMDRSPELTDLLAESQACERYYLRTNKHAKRTTNKEQHPKLLTDSQHLQTLEHTLTHTCTVTAPSKHIPHANTCSCSHEDTLSHTQTHKIIKW